MVRILLGVVALVVVAIGVAIFLLVRNLDAIVEAAIERYGTEAAGTPVRVGSVQIALGEGRATIRGLTVGSPRGFEAEHVFSWEEVTVDIDPQSVTSPPYVLDAVVIAGPEVVLELNERGQANLKVLRDQLGQAGGGGSEPGAAGGASEEPRLRIRRFAFEGGALEARTAAVGGKDVRTEMPPLRLEGLGGAQGATASEIGRSILLAYTEQALKTAAKRELGGRAERLIDEKLGGAEGKAAKGLLKGVLER